MSTRNTLTAARHIVVEGPIGVGKTSLAHRLGAPRRATAARTTRAEPLPQPLLPGPAAFCPADAVVLPVCSALDQLRELAQPDFFGARGRDFLLEKDRCSPC
jgi:deoxyguanosine kinase